MSEDKKFADELVGQDIVAENVIKQLLADSGGDIIEAMELMFREGLASRHDLGRLYGNHIGVSYVELSRTLFQSSIVEIIPRDIAVENNVIGIYQIGDAMTMATTRPQDHLMLGDIESKIRRKISPVFSFPSEIKDAIEIEYRSRAEVDELSENARLDKLLDDGKEVNAESLRQIAGSDAVIQFTHALLLLGIKERASDIHVEPNESNIRIRFRIDGVLQERLTLARDVLPPLVSRLKIMANLDITEHRRPQDGRIKLDMSGRSIDFRFSSVPALAGEKITLRILGQAIGRNVPELSELYFSDRILNRLKKVIETPNGIFFVTGPTGSGKTTTLYSCLRHLNQPGVNIMTIEDPVEYRLSGINQVQANSQIGFDFASALRAFLRQDPDIILVGEVRDMETARIASQAAITGHLVMATMHTNNSVQAITRLVEIGVEPFLVAPSVIGVLAQRLVRRICTSCSKKYPVPKETIERLFETEGEPQVFFYRGEGCEDCSNTGFRGRIAIHELFILNEELRAMVARESSILDIQATAVKLGFRSMRYDGIKKVLQGLTTIEEVERVTMAEDMM